MADYQFIRRYDTAAYRFVYLATTLVSIALFYIALKQPAAIMFGVFFGILSCLGIRGIIRGDQTGITIKNGILTCWDRRRPNLGFHANLNDLSSIEYKRFDQDAICLEFSDGTRRMIDERFFGELCELVSAVIQVRPDLTPVCLAGQECPAIRDRKPVIN